MRFATMYKDTGAKIAEHSVEEYPNEACGLIVMSALNGKPVVVKCKNISDDPSKSFIIDPSEYVDALKVGEVIGVWHSHVNQSADPSDADRFGCEVTNLNWTGT